MISRELFISSYAKSFPLFLSQLKENVWVKRIHSTHSSATYLTLVWS
jgi:hypothetical protein